MSGRRVQLAGPVNFRDLGGYPTTDGRTTRWGRVFRSDSLHRLDEADGPVLAELGIVTAIDFRANDELDRIGIGPLGDLDVRHVHLATIDRALHGRQMPDVSQLRTAAEIYFTMLETGAPSYAEALRELAEPGAMPAVFFCMAGKDRTGVFAALLLGLLGVRDDDIVADYALTAEVIEEIHARHRREVPGIDDQWARLPPDISGAVPRTMEGLLAAVHDRYGTWRQYATTIGVGDETLDRLTAELLD
ncbi:MAG TPA: tyrosine-protein phosphatase [Acidimicrobiia bacterium]|nr:tyrosine-protein phosphatase [Acidimicrobiia bacterium]